jgi:hypothetical protein
MLDSTMDFLGELSGPAVGEQITELRGHTNLSRGATNLAPATRDPRPET